eukprot:6491512-Amphidinium_carterae.1
MGQGGPLFDPLKDAGQTGDECGFEQAPSSHGPLIEAQRFPREGAVPVSPGLLFCSTAPPLRAWGVRWCSRGRARAEQQLRPHWPPQQVGRSTPSLHVLVAQPVSSDGQLCRPARSISPPTPSISWPDQQLRPHPPFWSGSEAPLTTSLLSLNGTSCEGRRHAATARPTGDKPEAQALGGSRRQPQYWSTADLLACTLCGVWRPGKPAGATRTRPEYRADGPRTLGQAGHFCGEGQCRGPAISCSTHPCPDFPAGSAQLLPTTPARQRPCPWADGWVPRASNRSTLPHTAETDPLQHPSQGSAVWSSASTPARAVAAPVV